MATMLPETNVLNLTSRLAPEHAQASEYRLRENQVLTRLMRELQSSLELDEILSFFMQQLELLINVDGVSYSHDESGLQFATAEQGLHKVNYQLNAEPDRLGVISFTRHQRFKEADLATIESFLSCLFYPLRNALKYHAALEAASTDALTGVGNRTGLDSALRREISLANRDAIPFSIVIFDFDHFKRINDQHGHLCGDLVLKQATMEIQRNLRKTDLLFRYGGEEFVLLLHKTSQQGAEEVAEKIRNVVEQTRIEFNSNPIATSVSLGVSALLPQQDCMSALIARADAALYQAKASGRNCVRTETGDRAAN